MSECTCMPVVTMEDVHDEARSASTWAMAGYALGILTLILVARIAVKVGALDV